MILESLRLSGWRNYREPTSFAFEPGLNLVVGVNEAGKSTLFEALWRTLFDRHTSKATELRRVRPLGSSLAPQVELTFLTGSRRYRVEKRFLSRAHSRLLVERGGHFELDHEGDRADQALRELLQGGSARGASRPEHRGLAQALWYLQEDDSLPKRAWSAALRQGLAGLLEASLTTPERDRFVARIEAEYRKTFTATGRIKKSSELDLLARSRPQLEAELERREGELERARGYRQDLEELGANHAQRHDDQRAVRTRIAGLLDQLQSAEALEVGKRDREERLRTARAETSAARRALERAFDLGERRKKKLRQAERLAAEEKALRASIRRLRRRAERHARRWEDELTPQLDATRGRARELERRLEAERMQLELLRRRAVLDRALRLGEQLAEVEDQRRAHGAPTAAEIEQARSLSEAQRLLAAEARGAAVRVRFDLEPDAPAVETEAPLDPEHGYLVTSPTLFALAGFGRFEVASGDGMLEELSARASEKREQLARLLAEQQADSVESLERRLRRGQELEARQLELQARLAELDLSSIEQEAEALATLAQEISELSVGERQAVLPGIEGWAEDRTLDEIQELNRSVRRLERQVKEERTAEHEQQARSFADNERLLETSSRLASVRGEAQTLQEQIDDSARELGSEAAQGERIERLLERERELELELTRFLEEYRARVELPRERLREQQTRERELARELSSIEEEIADRRARIEEVAVLGIDGQISDLEARLAVSGQRLEVLQVRSRATRLLRDLALHFKAHEVDQLTGPVGDLVDRWLRRLTGRAYRGLRLDDELVPLELEVAGHDESLPLASLSYGSHEQVVVLLRLAIAVLLSREERQLVVLDDRLVNADVERMQILCEILQEASSDCQIVIATCREAPYASLRANLLRVESQGRPATLF